MNYLSGPRRVFLLLAMAGGVLTAQIYPPGGYPPGGGYPGGGYPGGGYPYPRQPTGGGIPMPGGGKSSKSKTDTTKGPLPNFRGTLRQMDAKTITLVLGDDRQLLFKRNDKTKFFKAGEEVKNPKFNEGDQISVEGPEDAAGNMIAVNVYWEKGAGGPATQSSNKKDDGATVDTWKDQPTRESEKDARPSGVPAERPADRATESAPPPSVDPTDPGRPKLQRGKPADPGREHAKEPPVEQAQASAPPSIILDSSNPAGALPPPNTSDTPAAGAPGGYRSVDDESPRVITRQVDDLIRKATDAALDFTESLPNYVCTEKIARYQSETQKPNWQALDLISAEVVYENHKESYRNLQRNGRKIDKKMEELDGSWSTGEFGTILIDLFSPATAANFKYRKDSRSAGVLAKVYDFDVDHQHSHWNISVGGQMYSPAYKGAVWIDPATARVLRIEMQAYGFPAEFPDDHVESATDYEYTRLGDAKQYLLPVHSENLACQRGTSYCSRNAIDFANYHKYTGESTITFGK